MLDAAITVAGDSSSTRIYKAVQYDPFSVRTANTNAGVFETLTVKHSTGKLEGIPTQRHLLRLDQTRDNATTGVPVGAAVYVVVEHPTDDPTFTISMLRDMRTQMINLLVNANLDALVAGEK